MKQLIGQHKSIGSTLLIVCVCVQMCRFGVISFCCTNLSKQMEKLTLEGESSLKAIHQQKRSKGCNASLLGPISCSPSTSGNNQIRHHDRIGHVLDWHGKAHQQKNTIMAKPTSSCPGYSPMKVDNKRMRHSPVQKKE